MVLVFFYACMAIVVGATVYAVKGPESPYLAASLLWPLLLLLVLVGYGIFNKMTGER